MTRTQHHNTMTLPLLAAAALLCSLIGAAAIPSGAEARPKCAGKRATIVGTNGRDVIKPRRDGRDVIVARGGNDTIYARRGRDTVCAGPGNDIVYGGQGKDRIYGDGGNDFIDGGPGKDKLSGGAGADTAIGSAGGDLIQGGSGNDRVFGGIQDDKLWGGPGDDTLVGSQGIDVLVGAGGDDWLRGDTNADVFKGNQGSDTASFATATPPGPLPDKGGVIANLRTGKVTGDDSSERMSGIEHLVGSPFDDDLIGPGGSAFGGLGSNHCSGFQSTSCKGGTPSRSTAYVVGDGSPDPGVVLFGVGGADSWTVTAGPSGVLISGTALHPGDDCIRAGSGAVLCRVPPWQLGYILAWGASGDDRVAIGRGILESTVIKVDGGAGDDVLYGSRHADLLYSGEGGADRLYGRGGDDSLVSRGGGADSLFGGAGNDNLVTDDPCSPHLYNGGAGAADVASFGHVTKRGVIAKIGGRGKLRGSSCRGTKIKRNFEVLEGTKRADILMARRRSDLLIGRAGRDRCIGGRHKRC